MLMVPHHYTWRRCASSCEHVFTCNVYIRYSTPPDLQICFIQLTIHMWWMMNLKIFPVHPIQCDYSKNPEWFLWNDNHATSWDHPTVLAKVWNQRIIKIFATHRCWSECYHQCRRDSDPCWYVLMVISYFIFVVTYWTTLEVALFLELDVGLLKLKIYRLNLGHFGRFVSPVLDGCKGFSWVPQHLRC